MQQIQGENKPKQPCPACGHWHNRPACPRCSYVPMQMNDIVTGILRHIARVGPMVRIENNYTSPDTSQTLAKIIGPLPRKGA